MSTARTFKYWNLIGLSISISFLVISLALLYGFHCEECLYTDRIDLTNSSCIYSENLGRRLYFHICNKENIRVYDIRYFWKEELNLIKPQIIGVQLNGIEFGKLCKQCLV